MRGLIVGLACLAVVGGCGRIADESAEASVPPTDAGSDDGNEAGEVRADGCPATAASVYGHTECSSPGKECLYTETCARPAGAAVRFVCQSAASSGPYAGRWMPNAIDCSALQDDRGCPLGVPKLRSCSPLGLRCYYWPAACDPKYPASTVTAFDCTAADGGAVWIQSPDKVLCSELDAGS